MMATQTNKPEFPAGDMNASEEEELAFFNRRGCCIWLPCFGSSHSNTVWERISSTPEEEENTSRRRDWLGKGLKACKKVREWSELVAGPKWKTFIRRLSKNRGSKSGGKFNYDPFSYALNFDEGPGQNGLSSEDDDRIFRDFSSRYASLPMSIKSHIDLGKDVVSST